MSAIEALEQGCDRLTEWVEQASQGTIPRIGDALMLFEQQAEALFAVPVKPAPTNEEPVKIEAIPEPPEEAPAEEPVAVEEEITTAEEITTVHKICVGAGGLAPGTH